MYEIKDTGKVWIPGKNRPTFAIRVEDKFFVPGKEDDYTIDYWVEVDALCIDLCRPGRRIARKFDFSLTPSASAALFSGFEKTKHGDVPIILFTDPGVREFISQSPGIESMDRLEFWRMSQL